MEKWTRAELKRRAKENLSKNYWLCVGVSFLMIFAIGIGSLSIISVYSNILDYDKRHFSIPGSQYAYQTEQNKPREKDLSEIVLLHHYEDDHYYDEDHYYEDDYYDDCDYDIDDYYDDYDIDDYYDDNGYDMDDYYHNYQYGGSAKEFIYMMKKVLRIFLLIFLISFFISLAVSVFVFMPLQVGGCRFFMCNRESNGDLNQLLVGFRQGNYLNVVKIMFVRSIKIALWSLLFVIPGIIKTFEYSMIPYLLSENPGISKQEAFAVSKEMTNGEKWKMFVLGLSFLPWMLLGGFTFGLIYIFWLYPYILATNAELYAVLREKIRFNSGRIVGAENLRYMYADGYHNQAYGNYTAQQQNYNNNEKNNNTHNSYSNEYNSRNDMYSNNSYNGNSGEEKTYRNTLDDFDKKNNPPNNLL
ncbi:MAG: DUF975 family protein [Lachnospiraceae bacterium]|nr:DUF975 family protein [Lachnospiraceae bacterium]